MSSIRTLIRGSVAIAAVGILTIMTAAPANAVTATADAEGKTNMIVVQPGESKTVMIPDGSIKMTLELGMPSTVTAAQISEDEGLSAMAKSELLAAAAANPIKSNHWSQFTTGGAYTQTQNGTFYYNGLRVWVTQPYSGYTGSHSCFTNYVVWPWAISNVSKSESGSTTTRNLKCGWNVKQPKILLTTYAEMTANLHSNGTISGFGGTVG